MGYFPKLKGQKVLKVSDVNKAAKESKQKKVDFGQETKKRYVGKGNRVDSSKAVSQVADDTAQWTFRSVS